MTRSRPILLLAAGTLLLTIVGLGSWYFLRSTPTTEDPLAPATPAQSNAPEDLGEFPLQLDGIGPVRVGMSPQEASEVANQRIEIKGPYSRGCGRALPELGPEGLSFMILDGRIARVDVYSGDLTTVSGIGIGSTEQQVHKTYGERIRVESHAYVRRGHYLIYVPEDAEHAAYRLLFETDGQLVTSFRAGERQAVGFPEGCS